MVFSISSNKLQKIFFKKKELDKLVKRNSKIFEDLISNWFRTELTYSSNAIEGNTLSKLQTEVVINNGTTIGGKTVVEHLEAINHANAYDLVLSWLNSEKKITENDILEVHKNILKNIDNENAGIYRNIPVRISGSTTILPNYVKVPIFMKELIKNFYKYDCPIHQALFMHYQLVTIHPFIDGNGRTARLMMNYVLLNNDYPPAIIHNSSRMKYLKSLETAQTKGIYSEYISLLLKSIESSLDICIQQYKANNYVSSLSQKVMQIGELSKITKIPISTIRHWVSLGIILPYDTNEAGYQLFKEGDVVICRKVLELQKQKMTLKEILEILNK